jgi:hypothetical protein
MDLILFSFTTRKIEAQKGNQPRHKVRPYCKNNQCKKDCGSGSSKLEALNSNPGGGLGRKRERERQFKYHWAKGISHA